MNEKSTQRRLIMTLIMRYRFIIHFKKIKYLNYANHVHAHVHVHSEMDTNYNY